MEPHGQPFGLLLTADLIQYSLVVQLVSTTNPTVVMTFVHAASILGFLLLSFSINSKLAGVAGVSWTVDHFWIQALEAQLSSKANFSPLPHFHLYKLWTALGNPILVIHKKVAKTKQPSA